MSFFKFNNYTGRLATSSQTSSYMPAGFQVATESTPFQFDSQNTKPVVAPSSTMEAPASAAKGPAKGIVPSEQGYKGVRGLQSKMTIEDGLLVWQKRGGADRMPTWATFGIMTLATVYCFGLILKMSFPPKNK